MKRIRRGQLASPNAGYRHLRSGRSPGTLVRAARPIPRSSVRKSNRWVDLACYDLDGNQLWLAQAFVRFDPETDGFAGAANDIDVDSEGRIYVAGFAPADQVRTFTPDGFRADYTIDLDPETNIASAVAVRDPSRVHVGVQLDSSEAPQNALVRQYDADSQVLWETPIVPDDYLHLSEISYTVSELALDPAGRILAAATGVGGFISPTGWGVVYEPGDGEMVWADLWNWDPPASLRKFSPRGELIWERQFTDESGGGISDLAIDTDRGRLYALGFARGEPDQLAVTKSIELPIKWL